MGHVAAPELPYAWWQEPEPQDTWQLHSYPKLGGESQIHGTHGGSRAPLSREAGAGAMGHMAALELQS
jgi:hypothetical protein